MRSAKSAGCAACVARGHNRKPPATIQDQGMPISDIPLFSMLRTKMHWHQERQRLLAENVANADTAKFKPLDLAPPRFDGRQPEASALGLARTDPAHLAAADGGAGRFALDRGRD